MICHRCGYPAFVTVIDGEDERHICTQCLALEGDEGALAIMEIIEREREAMEKNGKLH